jgi:hypothetical protein
MVATKIRGQQATASASLPEPAQAGLGRAMRTTSGDPILPAVTVAAVIEQTST